MNHVQFGTNETLPDTGSVYPVGTAFLRSTPGFDLISSGLIGLGKCLSIGLKTTGELMELEDEDGALEALLKLNRGEDLTVKARFTRNVPAPRDFQFIGIKRRRSILIANDGTFNDNTVNEVFLITEVGEDYGSKAVAEYSLTCRRWDSLNVNARTAEVTTATGALVGPANPYPNSPG